MVEVIEPTLLTTAQLHREITWLRELIEGRLVLIDRALEQAQAILERQPTPAEIFARHDERFRKIEMQIADRNTRGEALAAEVRSSFETLVANQKEAVGVQHSLYKEALQFFEHSFSKQIEQLNITLASSTKSNAEKIGDLKDRVTEYEATGKGRTAGIGTAGTILLGTFSVISVFIGVIGLILAIVARNR